MRVEVLQHVPFEGLGSMRAWLKERGARIHFNHLWRGEPLPGLDAVDLVVAMGGPMSVNDEGRFPWLVVEKRWLEAAMTRGIPTLGVCLGAQLLSCVLGGRVAPTPGREIGWFEVQGLETASSFRFPDRFNAFHWHGEAYTLPDGCHQLARSAACEQQAFQYGRHAIGLQFHLETTPETMHGLIARLGQELQPGPWVQCAEQMRAEPAASFEAIHALMGEVVAYLHAAQA